MTSDVATAFHEEAQLAAWDDFAAARKAADATWSDPRKTMFDRIEAHKAAISAHDRFAKLFLAPTPEHLRIESGRLFAEGFMLLAVLCGIIGLLLPALEITFWPLALALVMNAALGGWAIHYLGRLGRHLRRRA